VDPDEEDEVAALAVQEYSPELEVDAVDEELPDEEPPDEEVEPP
jgi:hypothetical protein